MAALTETQLQSACRAKFPITVVRDEDYTTMTPAEVAAAWSAAVFWDGTTYLKNVAGTWEAFTDEATVNDRGLYVGGGLVNYAELQDFSDYTAAQPLPGTWDVNSDITCVCSAKGTEGGLPYVTLSFTGDPNLTSIYVRGPISQLSAGVITEGSILVARNMATIVQVPTEVTEIKGYVYQVDPFVGDKPDNGIVPGSYIYDANIIYGNDETAIDSVFPLITCSDATFDAALLIKVFPRIFYSAAAVPETVTYVNTTTDPQTVTPQVVQRPWEYDGPWSVEIEFTTPPRNLEGYPAVWQVGTDQSQNQASVYWAPDGVMRCHVMNGGATVMDSGTAEVTSNTTTKIVVYQTAQVTKWFRDGEKIGEAVTGRTVDGVECLGHKIAGGNHIFATFKSLVYRKGLATDAQLEEWSTAA